jgi:CRISPR-associated protein Cas2
MTDFYLICFDVHEARRLRKVAVQMENFGQRVQRSVFECHLQAEQLQELQQRLAAVLEPLEDQVRYYRLCGKDKQSIVIDGPGWVSSDPDYLLL